MDDIKEEVREFMKERKWLDQPPGDVAKSIVIEGAELLEHFQWSNFFDEEIEKDPQIREEIKQELADVLIYCLEMAIILDCDPKEIIRSKLALAAKKYPAGSVDGQLGSKKYREIKKRHRAAN